MAAIGAFGDYLTAAFPSQINVDVTEFCNLACIHCPYESVIKPKGKARNNLSPAIHAKMVAEIAAQGKDVCRFIRYSGEGEPLLHPYLMDFLHAVAPLGIMIALTTNGLLLTEERCRSILAARVGVIDISLDAFKPETYAKIRVGGELAAAKDGILRLFHMARAQGSPLKIMVSFIRQAANAGEENDFLTFWREQGLDNVFVRNLHSCAGLIDEIAAKLRAEAPLPRRPCVYPWERLLVKPDGTVAYCPADWQQGTMIGDLATDTLQELWQGEAMQAVRLAHLTNDFSNHPFCGQCPDWSVIKWPGEGRSYATAIHEFEAKKDSVMPA